MFDAGVITNVAVVALVAEIEKKCQYISIRNLVRFSWLATLILSLPHLAPGNPQSNDVLHSPSAPLPSYGGRGGKE